MRRRKQRAAYRSCQRERGTHQELLTQRGLYWKLYQLQYKDQELGVHSVPAREPSIAPAV